MRRLLRIDERDNVAVAMVALSPGVVEGLAVTGEVPAGHKVALGPIRAGEAVVKYGYPIGLAARDIAAGEHVHSHNVRSHLQGDLSSPPTSPLAPPLPPPLPPGQHPPASPPSSPPASPFRGYRRHDGQAATRNEVWIVNTVGCVNRASEMIAAAASRELGQTDAIDGVQAFPHPFGCSQLGDDLHNTQKVLAGLINHPNAGGVLVLGLGCENNQLRSLLERAGNVDPERVRFFNAQEVGDEVEEGVRAVRALVEYAGQFRRQPIPVSELVVGMKCGGSDGFSGVTANPLVGRVADRLTGSGATVLLSEVPEMFGAEQVLLERAGDAATGQAVVDLVNQFREYFRSHDEPIDENPSPGNRDGGITTLAEKSLGCVQKGGRAPVRQVLPYGHPAATRLGGLALVNAPGNDGVSSTAMTAAGAHLLLFTTGRGTPMGFPVPTLKISTNSGLAARKSQWIDFDAGPLATSDIDMDVLADRLLSVVLATASGDRTRNEINGYREIAIWKDGVTL